jgi:hypothetical protein
MSSCPTVLNDNFFGDSRYEYGYASFTLAGGRKCISAYDIYNDPFNDKRVGVDVDFSSKKPVLKCTAQKDAFSFKKAFYNSEIDGRFMFLRNLTSDDKNVYFEIAACYLEMDGKMFLRLPINGYRSLCAVVSLGIDPDKIGYLREHGYGTEHEESMWQNMADDFLLNIHGAMGYAGEKHTIGKEVDVWKCTKNAENIMDVYYCSAHAIPKDSRYAKYHATPIIPLVTDIASGSLRVDERYIGLVKRIVVANLNSGGYVGSSLSNLDDI